jgi:hypothetical protein
MDTSPTELGPKSDSIAKAQYCTINYRPVLSSERAPHKKNIANVEVKRKIVAGLRWWVDDGLAD